MIRPDSRRSTDDSTSATNAGDSSPPHGLCGPNASAYHSSKSILPDLAASRPISSYTQWRGKVLAPVILPSDVPSAAMVSDRVVQQLGPTTCTNGAPRTVRGAGIPGRPPAVCSKVTACRVASGTDCSIGKAVGTKVISMGPILKCVSLRRLRPEKPWSTIAPSRTSTHAFSSLAKRNPPRAWSASRSSSSAGGGSSYRPIPMTNGILADPSIASEGIHDKAVTTRSIRMLPKLALRAAQSSVPACRFPGRRFV